MLDALLRQVATGSLDGRTRRAAVRAVRRQLAADPGATWDDLPLQQRPLVDQAEVKATILGVMAGHALGGTLVDENGWLGPPLGDHCPAWSNSMRFDLQALGLERKAKDVVDVAAELARASRS